MMRLSSRTQTEPFFLALTPDMWFALVMIYVLHISTCRSVQTLYTVVCRRNMPAAVRDNAGVIR